jgi:hypothetical protein
MNQLANDKIDAMVRYSTVEEISHLLRLASDLSNAHNFGVDVGDLETRIMILNRALTKRRILDVQERMDEIFKIYKEEVQKAI